MILRPEHLLDELNRRIAIAMAKQTEVAQLMVRLSTSIDRTGLVSDATQGLWPGLGSS